MTYQNALPKNTLLNNTFVIDSQIGQGGFGITYLAHHHLLTNRKFAIKEFFLSGHCNRVDTGAVQAEASLQNKYAEYRNKFIDEARLLALLDDAENVVSVSDFFEQNNTAYMVMPFVASENLEQYTQRQPNNLLPETEAIDYIKQVAIGLRAAHQHKILHRDIKPSNLLRKPDGTIIIIDFGSAREYITLDRSQTMSVIYTPGYAPPEQYSLSAKRGSYSDIYALGATLYRLLTGKAPADALDRLLDDRLTPPNQINPNISPQITQIVMKAMCIKPVDRLQTIDDFLQALPKKITPAPKANEGGTSIKEPLPKPPTPAPPTVILPAPVQQLAHDMVFVEGGTFTMGEEKGFWSLGSDNAAHQVSVDSFRISKYLVTQELWQAVMGNNPSYFKGNNLPVERVSWNDVQEFLRKLNAQTNEKYRLPTEAEWEYAARGGKYSNNYKYKYAGSNNIDEVAWHAGNSDSKTHRVGQKKANQLGLYDLSGNVWEWCNDWYDADYYKKKPKNNPTGPTSGNARVVRGGSWYPNTHYCQVSDRNFNDPSFRYILIGFRVSRRV